MNSFLQSDQWAKFQNSIGRKTLKVDGIYLIKYNLPLGKSYLYSPRCVGNFVSENFINKIKEIAEKENAIFLKLELQSLDFARDKSFGLEEFGFKKSNSVQPLQTIILDITKSEEELLNQMHPKTRYNINLAQKKEIFIKKQEAENRKQDYFEEFWKLMTKTSGRDGFTAYSKEYYRKMLEIPGVELFVAEYGGKIIAANIVFFYKEQAPTPTSSGTGQAIYLHGASDYEYRNLMAPHLLQWEQIKEAKRRNCTEYDFWGINEDKWPGVTRFKRGFGGQEITYPGAYDLIFKPFWYKIYKLAKRIL